MKLTFLGATKQVTGSMYLITLQNGYKILVDCGMDYELKRNPVQQDNIFPFNPVDIDLVLLTHAHIDHSGNLPTLFLQGYKGKILCTPATADLTSHLLFDSANIQLHEYRQQLAKARKNRRHLIAKPLFNEKLVAECLDAFVTINFYKPFIVNDKITVTLIEAGHLLGAASIKVEVTENDKKTVIGFSGDLGRSGSKLINDTQIFDGIDYLVTESTYGGRKHLVERKAELEMLDYITETCVKINGRLIIPAFSVGRTQSIIFTINQLKKRNLIPASLTVFVDSPLAIKSTHVYEKNHHLMNAEAKAFYQEYGDLFHFESIKYLADKSHHDDIMYHAGPCIIVSAAGMVEGGRIQEHISNNIENPFSTILIAGFCAEGTLGHKLLQGLKRIGLKNGDKNVYAKIAKTDVFSSHPDHDEIVKYISTTCVQNKIKNVFLIHGEEPQLNATKDALADLGLNQVVIPNYLEEFSLA